MPTLMLLAFLTSRAAATVSVSLEHHLNPGLTSNLYRRGNVDQVDKSLLAIQVGGIVATYVVFVSILLSLLLSVGRRLRQAVHSSNYTLQVEMMKPINPPSSMDPSPVTPLSAHIPTPDRTSGYARSWTSLGKPPRAHKPSNDRSAAAIDESVVASDRRRAQEQMEMLYAAVMEHDEQKAAMTETAKDNNCSSASSNTMQSPDSVLTNPFTDRSSRILEEPSSEEMKQAPTSPRSSNSRLSKRISSLSLFSSNSRMSPGPSKMRSPRLPIRKLAISSPMASPDITATSSYGEDQPPLTPRLYNLPPAPPAPPTHATNATHTTHPFPAPPPAKSSGMGRARAAPAPLSLSTTNHMASSGPGASQARSSLPFRDAFPPQSAPATKTTILERPTKPLNGPRTGMPTPYSPYMPFTPVTPLTPSRMVTRQQRKQKGKENGLRVLNEDDVVKGDEDMWGY